jgi:hypothetical protein
MGESSYAIRVMHVDESGTEMIAEWCDPGVVMPATVADLDGDGKAEIIVAYTLRDFSVYRP